MFTGITRGIYPVARVERRADLLSFWVQLPTRLLEGLESGASVAIDGVCQTVVEIDGNRVKFEAIRETLDRTTLGDLRADSLVSVERSFKVGDEIGGHEVSGHIIGTGTVHRIEVDGDVYSLEIQVPAEWMKYIQPKGFIAVDGSSLTVGKTSDDGRFWLHLIPETLRLTNLGGKKPGERVNIELESRTVTIVDTVERLVERLVETRLEQLLAERLR